ANSGFARLRVADQHYRWVIVAYSLVIQAVSVGILVYCFALFSLPWLDEFGASRRDVMITITGMQLGMGLLSPMIGRAMDHFPMQQIVLLGVALLAAGLWLVQRSTALWQIWLIYATLMPLSTAMMGTLASQTMVAKWFVQQRGLALGLSAMGTNVGGLLLPALVAGLLVEVGWRETFHYLALLCLIIVVPLTLLVLRRQPPAAEPLSTTGGQPVADDYRWSTREILTTRLFWLPFLSLVPLNMAFGALQFNLGGFARDIGATDESTAVLITVSAAGMVMGKLFCGSLGDRLDHRVLFWLANLVMCVALGLLLRVGTYEELLVAVLCMGVAGGGILPMMGLIFSARFGAQSFGRVMGFVMLNVMLGGFAPVFAGWSYDLTGNYNMTLWALYGLTVPAMLAMIWLPRPEHANRYTASPA
ncbi:MAG: MFS transporter, partial [Pseudomonadota bacterium]